MPTFRQGMQPGLFGAPMLSAATPQNNEGLGLPGGQAIFNLPRTGNVPGTTVTFPSGQVGGGFGTPSLKLSITRTASSDPVQNIINDISNPLSGANINLGQGGQKQQRQQQPMPMLSAGSFDPALHMQTMAWPGQQAGVPFAPTMAPPGQNFGMMARQGLKQRMTNPMAPFAFL